MVALPASAFAAGSPTSTSKSGDAISATYTGTKDINGLNLVNNGNDSWTVTWADGTTSNFGSLTLTFTVGTQYAGQTATILIQHQDGTTETQTAVVSSNGTISLTVTQLSKFTVSFGGNTVATSSTSATSPKTGVDVTTVAFATLGAAIVAGGIVVALRKQDQR